VRIAARFLIVLGCMAMAQASTEVGACTVFASSDGTRVVVGKNLDWEDGSGQLLLNPRGQGKVARVGGFAWEARYGSVTFNQFGRGRPLGGMNEAGLVVEEASYWPSRHPEPDGIPRVDEFEWIQFQLDRFGSVDEVVENLDGLGIEPSLGGLHYFVADRGGRVAIVEFLAGSMVVHRPDVPVLTNDTWERSRDYLARHAGFGGTRVVGPGPESPERFVRAATLLAEAAPTVEDARRILDDVAQDDTVWRLVYDPVELAVHYQTMSAPGPKSLTLQAADFERAARLSLDARVTGDVRSVLDRSSPATVTLLANAGISLQLDGTVLLVDALFDLNGPAGAPPSRYAHLDPLRLDQLERGIDPFGCADLVLITHGHDDHATRGSVMRHLEHCPESELYLPDGAWPGFTGPAGRTHPVLVRRGQVVRARDHEVRIEALGFRHGSRTGHEPAHVGWLIQGGGARILHVGDATPMPDNLHDFSGALAAPVDLVLVPHWFITHEGGRRWLLEDLRPSRIAVVHVVTKDPRVMEGLAKIQGTLPDLIVLSESGQRVDLTPTR
jgi:choloylglycine hydrolase